MVVGVLVGILLVAASAYVVYESAWGSWRRTARFPATRSDAEPDWDALRSGGAPDTGAPPTGSGTP